MFTRPAASLSALWLLSTVSIVQAADKPTDPQIAHIAYTAGVIDIEAARTRHLEIEERRYRGFRQRHGPRPQSGERSGA